MSLLAADKLGSLLPKYASEIEGGAVSEKNGRVVPTLHVCNKLLRCSRGATTHARDVLRGEHAVNG